MSKVTLLKNGRVFTGQGFDVKDVFVSDGKIFGSGSSFDLNEAVVIDCSGKVIVPGFTDVHVHLREPGFFYKETIKTGTLAAARGGYTCVCPMPNLNPAPSTLKALKVQLDIIERDACINTVPYGTITMNQNGQAPLSNMEEMAPFVCAFSDDGKGIQEESLMKEAMSIAKDLGKLIVAHCEDESLLDGGYIHKGEYAKLHGHRGISSESEWRQVERDINLAYKTNCPYHVCHISTKETVSLIREAKKSHIDVTCETGPHYLILTDMDLKEEGRFKMNPPLRSHEDREALLEGICDGTIDMIATDHAPHSPSEKSKGLKDSAFGITGLETAFPLLFTYLVEKKIISLEKLVQLMSINPRKRFNLPGGLIEDGMTADLTLLNLDREFTINSENFLSMGKATPFDGYKLRGLVEMTMAGGNIVWEI